ncbi:30S ribosomal protein S15 [Mycoplasma zalophi]|uniref:Small ribosomal subunit protein uS15 n=1 Tax=Mycoplasma zalophi TaxID=191287 RepID=A0ABS6DQA1_9MOLU|nr:30S ribosomal protein S15 [Mycoplasma zalophi]MBU4691288.1 30S ribosomal protein S15 [Mycoplasma zalophi]MBU4692506.1 30S ribosomal protein S15 [Mycoplasma zalophi]MCU4117340.1 30S ribosomal protein S15 [Mycoplasma zalophi]
MITKEKKLELIKKFGKNEKDSGSIEVQIAILTEDIESLKNHFQTNKKDLHSMRGFMAKVNHRKSLLAYLKSNDQNAYLKLIQELKIRK